MSPKKANEIVDKTFNSDEAYMSTNPTKGDNQPPFVMTGTPSMEPVQPNLDTYEIVVEKEFEANESGDFDLGRFTEVPEYSTRKTKFGRLELSVPIAPLKSSLISGLISNLYLYAYEISLINKHGQITPDAAKELASYNAEIELGLRNCVKLIMPDQLTDFDENDVTADSLTLFGITLFEAHPVVLKQVSDFLVRQLESMVIPEEPGSATTTQ